MNGTLACQEIVELVTDYLEDSMEPALRLRFEEHLAMCPGCRDYLRQMRETIRLSGRLSAETLSPQLQEELVRAFRNWSRG